MITIDGLSLTIEDIIAVARGREPVELAAGVRSAVEASRAVVDRLVRKGIPAYGITTGVGDLRDVVISPVDAARFQRNLIHSHACGVGDCLPTEVVRAALVIRLNMFAQGYSGVRYDLLTMLAELLNRGVHPCVPERSTSGSSGGMSAPAHIALVLMGEGKAFFEDELISGAEALQRAGLSPVELAPKEGLSLINGTNVITGQGVLAWEDTFRLAQQADIALALSLEALRGRPDAFDERTHQAKRYPGQQRSAANARKVIDGSDLHDQAPTTIQDAYSLRCAPQVHGAAREAFTYVRHILETEANSAVDNPMVYSEEGDIVSGGNFHGETVAIALDTLGIACSELANISERRTAWLVDAKRSGLPAFLTQAGGLNSGLMIPQYVAVSLVTENKVLAGPASVDSIPTSANQEDFVSGGPIAARKAATIVSNAQYVLAIELLCASQALDLQSGLRLGHGTHAAHRTIRRYVPTLEEDRILADDIEHLRELVQSGELVTAVEASVSPLD